MATAGPFYSPSNGARIVQFEIVAPQKTHGPFDTPKQVVDAINSLGLRDEDRDKDGGWSVQVVGTEG